MAKKISELAERLLVDISGAEEFEIIDDGVNYRLGLDTLVSLVDVLLGVAALQAEVDALQIYDVGGAWNGVPDADALIVHHIFVRPVTFADDFAGAVGTAKIAATGVTVFDIKKNGASVGSMTWAAAGTTPTFSTTGTTVSFIAGDILEVVAPATPDATLATVSFTLTATRD